MSIENIQFLRRSLENYLGFLPTSFRTGIANRPDFSPMSYAVPRDLQDGPSDMAGFVRWRLAKGQLLELAYRRWIATHLHNAPVPSIWSDYLLNFRVFRMEIRWGQRAFLLPSTGTLPPLFDYQQLLGSWKWLLEVGFLPLAESVDREAILCFDLSRMMDSDDAPIVQFPLVPLFRSFRIPVNKKTLDSCEPVEVFPSFRDMFDTCCMLPDREAWKENLICPFTHPTTVNWPRSSAIVENTDSQDSEMLQVYLQNISAKLETLRQFDPAFAIETTRAHRFRMNPTLQRVDRLAFETSHNVTVPAAYAAFLENVGNGGAGLGMGLTRLEAVGSVGPLVAPELLPTPFPYTSYWNLKCNDSTTSDFEVEYFRADHISGTIPLFPLEDGSYVLLVISGAERGHLWIDDRGNENGLRPLCQEGPWSFLRIYDHWLDDCYHRLSALWNRRA